MQQPNWNDIRAFLAVSQAGRLGVAANRLKVDPTTLSRRVKRLEQDLQCTLFERSRTGLILTEAGEKLQAKAEAMSDAAREIDDQLAETKGLNGTLRISVSEGFGSQFLTHYVRGFADLYPGIRLELVASSGFLSPSRREADIAVMLSRPRAGPVTSRRLADYELQMFASERYIEEMGQPNSVDELADEHRLIGYIPDLLYAPELNYLNEIHPGLESRISSSSLLAQAELVSQAAGIAVLPCFLAVDRPGFVTVLPKVRIRRTFWLVAHQDTQNIGRIRAGKDWLVSTVENGAERLAAAT